MLFCVEQVPPVPVLQEFSPPPVRIPEALHVVGPPPFPPQPLGVLVEQYACIATVEQLNLVDAGAAFTEQPPLFAASVEQAVFGSDGI